MQAVAVVRLRKTDRAAFEQSRRRSRQMGQNQERSVHAFEEAQAAAVAEAFAIAFGNAAYRFDRYKKKPSPPNLQKPCSTPHEAAVKEPLRVAEAQFTDKASAVT